MFTDIIHKKLEENFASVLKTTESGISELLWMGAAWEAKNLLKWLAFSF